jgi:hypothetical protein
MPNYSPSTQVKINYMTQQISEHPDWGSSKLQNEIKEQFGSALKKNYLLQESQKYRESEGIRAPKVYYSENQHFKSILRKGGYTDFERQGFEKQIERYTPAGRTNFIYSETLRQAAADHATWFNSLLADARKGTSNLTQARALVYNRLEQLFKQGEYDPFKLLQEQEKADTVFSGVIKIRKLNRDYTERRREDARRKRDLVRQKVLR